MAEPIYVTKGGGTEAVAAAAVVSQGMESFEGVITELLRAAAANPIVAAVSMIIITDILARNNVISKDAAAIINTFIGALTAVEVVGDIFKTSGGVQTLVYGDGAGAGINSAALLSQLAKKV